MKNSTQTPYGGNQEWQQSYEARRANLFKPVEPGSMQYYIALQERDHIFNVHPILKVLEMHEPGVIIKQLEIALSDLSMYYLNDESVPASASHTALVLKNLRDALMTGMGYFSLDPYFEEFKNKEGEFAGNAA
ncbi:hypothetical protein [Pontibacter sp. SGAir0037]|uniref:hypothetical protein n=1 Tax=Pontibacter sp. SGAir0037 TaxID=2571030 RepID=UPI0010CD32B1|nr:hypothetical protein [Pontibacter sp. SGAir0037]QCR24761.1 hypothetical protein C1N53_21985 [Pontibacter sp. SGAir0037]